MPRHAALAVQMDPSMQGSKRNTGAANQNQLRVAIKGADILKTTGLGNQGCVEVSGDIKSWKASAIDAAIYT